MSNKTAAGYWWVQNFLYTQIVNINQFILWICPSQTWSKLKQPQIYKYENPSDCQTEKDTFLMQMQGLNA